MDSKILLGVIAVTIFGTLAAQSIMVEAGMVPLEVIQVAGNQVTCVPSVDCGVSSLAACPAEYQVIGGETDVDQHANFITSYEETIILNLNSYGFAVFSDLPAPPGNFPDNAIIFQAVAHCSKINFPMNMGSMIGGELLDINTVSLLVSAIGVNPVITGLVGITLAGVAVQTVWFVYQRKKKNE